MGYTRNRSGKDVSPARLERFFVKEDHGYRVTRELREAVVFTTQDLLADAPFSRLDFVSCRNVLIYLRPEVQEKVLSLFHFALREDGILVLGASEAIGGFGDRFEPISKKQRIFRHLGRSRPGEVVFPDRARPKAGGRCTRCLTRRLGQPRRASRPADLARQALLDAYAPASVLINARHEGLYYFGPIDRYLKVAAGEASRDLFAMARDGLRTKLRAAIRQAGQRAGVRRGRGRAGGPQRQRRCGRASRSSRCRPRAKGFFWSASRRTRTQEKRQGRDRGRRPSACRPSSSRNSMPPARNWRAQSATSRSANDELTATNEEAMSVNEELQSTNEELETSKEELQSLNEELTALNSQLNETIEQSARHRQRPAEHHEQLGDRDAVPGRQSRDPTLHAGREDDVQRHRFGHRPAARRSGPPAPTTLACSPTPPRCSAGHVPPNREVEAENGAWYTRRILPYRTQDDQVEGVVDHLRRHIREENRRTGNRGGAVLFRQHHQYHSPAARRARRRALRDLREPLLLQHFFGQARGDRRPTTRRGRSMAASISRRCAASSTASGAASGSSRIIEIDVELPPRGMRSLLVNALEIREEPLATRKILVTIDDITERKRVERGAGGRQADGGAGQSRKVALPCRRQP